LVNLKTNGADLDSDWATLAIARVELDALVQQVGEAQTGGHVGPMEPILMP